MNNERTMNATIEHITPDIARSYLATMKTNRKPSRPVVNRYASDMKNGLWQLTGQGIIFDEEGRLSDGQHRLLSVIESGVTVDFLVIRNEPTDSYLHDRGRSRTTKNSFEVLGMEPWKCSHTMIGVLNALLDFHGKTDNYALSDSVISEFLDDNEEMLRKASSLVGRQMYRAGVVAAIFCCLFNKKNEEKLGKFLEILDSGISYGIGESSPLVLRRTILDARVGANRATLSKRGGHLANRFLISVTLQAVNDYFSAKDRIKNYKERTDRKFDFELVDRLLIPKYLGDKDKR